MYKVGHNTDTIIFKKNGNEVHHSFIVDQIETTVGEDVTKTDTEVFEGQPVAITKAGKIIPLHATASNIYQGAAGTLSPSYIGVALMGRKTGESVTVCVRGRIIVKAIAHATLVGGPVVYSQQKDSVIQPDLKVPGFNNPATATSELHMIGWALAPASSGEEVYVLYKH